MQTLVQCQKPVSFSKKTFYRFWPRAAETQKRGFVWILHGMGEHVGRYSELALYLNNLGFDVGGPDLPGHGHTRVDGGSTFVPTLEELNQSQAEILAQANSDQNLNLQNEKWFLLGHSMGALLGLTALSNWLPKEILYPAKFFGVGPPLKIRKALNPAKSMGVKLLTEYLPNLTIPNGEVGPEDLSFDIANVGSYREDKYVHPYMNARQFDSWRIKTDELFKDPNSIKCPVFLASGEEDWVSCPKKVRELFDALLVPKRFLLVPNTKHEVLFEYGREKTFQALVSWFAK